MKYVLIWFFYTGMFSNHGAVEFSTLEECNLAKEKILSKALVYSRKLDNHEMVECFKK